MSPNLILFIRPPFHWTRFEAGTPAIGEAVGLGAAIDYLSGIGMQKIHDYEVSSILLWSRLSILSIYVFLCILEDE